MSSWLRNKLKLKGRACAINTKIEKKTIKNEKLKKDLLRFKSHELFEFTPKLIIDIDIDIDFY